ncbi:hypothetical protein BD309DRAFT_737546 [Dichomitus squalens]|nr:hypothetical protein BD309DRAFT_737546 [Dichomitus squalens]
MMPNSTRSVLERTRPPCSCRSSMARSRKVDFSGDVLGMLRIGHDHSHAPLTIPSPSRAQTLLHSRSCKPSSVDTPSLDGTWIRTPYGKQIIRSPAVQSLCTRHTCGSCCTPCLLLNICTRATRRPPIAPSSKEWSLLWHLERQCSANEAQTQQGFQFQCSRARSNPQNRLVCPMATPLTAVP